MRLSTQLILQPFRRFTYITVHSPTLPLHHLRHSSFSNPSFASPMSQAHELCSFSNLSVTSPTSQLISQPFRRFTYVTAHSPTLTLLHLRHSSFSNSSFASPMSQAHELCSFSKFSVTTPTSLLILQLFRRFTYITAHSPTLLLLHLRHSSFSNPSFASPTSQDLHLIHAHDVFYTLKTESMQNFNSISLLVSAVLIV